MILSFGFTSVSSSMRPSSSTNVIFTRTFFRSTWSNSPSIATYFTSFLLLLCRFKALMWHLPVNDGRIENTRLYQFCVRVISLNYLHGVNFRKQAFLREKGSIAVLIILYNTGTFLLLILGTYVKHLLI